MKVWPIDPLVPRNLRLEVPEKLPQGLTLKIVPGLDSCSRSSPAVAVSVLATVKKPLYRESFCRATHLDAGNSRLGLQYQTSRIIPCCGVCSGQTGKNLKNRDNPQLTWLPCILA
jgi:hypothetical protein